MLLDPAGPQRDAVLATCCFIKLIRLLQAFMVSSVLSANMKKGGMTCSKAKSTNVKGHGLHECEGGRVKAGVGCRQPLCTGTFRCQGIKSGAGQLKACHALLAGCGAPYALYACVAGLQSMVSVASPPSDPQGWAI